MRGLVLVAVAACGGNAASGDAAGADASGNSVQGTIVGTPFVAQSAMSAKIAFQDGSSVAEIVMSTRPNACADRTAGAEQANASIIAIIVGVKPDANTSTAPTMAGTFPIKAMMGPSSSLAAVTSDAMCHDVPGSSASAA